jgi:ribosomal protein S18 acetylase RimI-like enzyme
VEIRRYRAADETEVVAVWLRAGRDEYSYLPMFLALTEDTGLEVFRNHILPGAEVWLAWESGRLLGFLAQKGSFIDRLYVDPGAQRRGVGSRLLAFARERSPGGLELFTHQQNSRARAFYEKHGFRAVRFGVSPPPESVPDVEYHWRPEAG